MMLHRMAVLLGCGVLFLPSPVLAESVAHVAVITPLRPPYVVDAGAGFADGPAVRLVQRLAEIVGIDPAVQVVPFERAVMTLDRGDTLYPALLRTPGREGKYQWIGEVHADAAVMFTRRDTQPAPTLAGAAHFSTITIMRGSELVTLLRTAGLANVRTANSEIDNARMLAAGRVDAWFAPAAVGRATWNALGYEPAGLRAGPAMAALSFWVAASQNLAPATVARLRDAYRELRASGEYDRIVAPLGAAEGLF